MEQRRKYASIVLSILCVAAMLFTGAVSASNEWSLSTAVTDSVYENGEITANIAVYSTGITSDNVIVFGAIKNKDSGKLLACDISAPIVLENENKKAEIRIPYTGAADDYIMEIYVWDNLVDMNPMSAKTVYDPTLEDGIEPKDITSVKVYRTENGRPIYCEELNPEQIDDYSNYVVEVQMMDMPAIYSGIKDAQLVNGQASIELEKQGLISYDKDLNPQRFKVSYPAGSLDDLNILLEQIQNNPSGTFTLDRDYDAENVVIQRRTNNTRHAAAIIENFTGTINGNGHTIYNLQVPLFMELDGAVIEGLVFRDVNMNLDDVILTGTLANKASNSQIKDVHVRNLTLYSNHKFSGYQNKSRRAGGLIADVSGASKISSCSVTNFAMKGQGNNSGGWFGGICGYIGGSTVVEDCLAIGGITNVNGNNYAYKSAGGLVGFMDGNTIINRCIAEVENKCPNRENGGLVGFTNAPQTVRIENSLAMGNTTSGSRFIDVKESPLKNAKLSFISNCFELDGTTGATNVATVKEIVIEIQYKDGENGELIPIEVEVEKDVPEKGGPVDTAAVEMRYSTSFYTDTLKLTESEWNITDATYIGYPYPGDSFPHEALEIPETHGAYVPNYDVFTQMPEYDDQNFTAYSNAYKLAPYLNCSELVKMGNKLAQCGGELTTKDIGYILPVSSGKYQAAVTGENYQSIDGVLLIFTDDTKAQYTLMKPERKNEIVYYTIEDLDVRYAYDHYVVDVDNGFVQELVGRVGAVEYENDLITLVGGRDINTSTYAKAAEDANSKNLAGQTWSSDNDMNRLDEVWEELHNAPEEFVYALLSSEDSFYSGTDNPAVQALTAYRLEGESLLRLIYSYLYIQRWYDIDLGAVNLADLMYFDSEFYGGNSGAENIAAAVVDADRSYRRGNSTNNMYTNRLKPIYKHTKISELVEKNVLIFESESDSSQWFREFFKGPLEERQVTSLDGTKKSRTAWQFVILNQNRILPMLTLENDPINGKDLYLVTYAHTIHYGVVSSYASDFTDPAQYAVADQKVKAYANRWDNLIRVSATFVENSYNTLLRTDYESRDSSYMMKYGNTARVPCSDPKASPAMRDFCAVIGTLQKSNDANAWANGWLMVLETGKALEEDAIGVQTHENAHNTASKYFYGGHSNRMGSEGETNGILAQFHNNMHVMDYSLNLMNTYPATSEYIGSLDFERLGGMNKDGTKTNIHDFYRKYFEAMYTLDLLEARAVLSLDQETQRNLLYKHSYPNLIEDEEQTYLSKRDSTWAPIADQEEYNALNIQNYTDIIKNQMNITRDVEPDKKYIGAGNYNFSSPFSACLWSPINDMGRADQVTAKKLPYEFLGESGWQYGFANYLSKSTENGSNDLGALRVAMRNTDLLSEPVLQNGEYNLDPDTMTLEDWKLARYKVTEDKLDNIKSPYFDVDMLEAAYRAAFIADANNYSTTSGIGANPKLRQNVKPYSASIRLNALRYFLRITNNFESGIYEEDIDEVKISTAQQLIDGINNNPLGNFKLTEDLDFASVQSDESAYITVDNFMGRINGDNGSGGSYRIKNLSKPLLENIMYAHIENIIFDGANISQSTEYTAVVSRKADKGYFGDIHIVNTTLNGNKVGGIVGFDYDPKGVATGSLVEGINLGSSTFSGVSVNADITGSKVSGGIASVGYGSFIANSYVTGSMNVSGGNRGGFIGNAKGSGASQSYTAIDWKKTGSAIFGYNMEATSFAHIFEAKLTWQYPSVTNCFAVNLSGNAKKFYSDGDGFIKYGYLNNYEYVNSPGTKTADGIYIKEASEEDLTGTEFYKTTLQLSDSLWDLSSVNGGKLPILNNSDPNATGAALPKISQ